MAEAFADTAGAEAPRAVAVRGTGSASPELAVPYRGERLTGEALRRRLERWVRDGIVEPTCADAVGAVIAHPEWLRLEGRRIALIGAGAEIGPLAALSAWGAEVVALDVPGRALWERVVAIARRGAGIMHVPLVDDPSAAMTRRSRTPRDWIWFPACRPRARGWPSTPPPRRSCWPVTPTPTAPPTCA